MNFNQLDNRHKRAMITHAKLFRAAVDRLTKNLSVVQQDALIHDLTTEAMDFVNFLGDEEVNEIVASIENDIDTVVP